MNGADTRVRILQVDDDPLFNAVLLQHFSRHQNVDLDQVTSIAAAEQRLTQGSVVDVLLLDLSLPDRDGFEYLSTLSSAGFQGKLIIVSSQPRSVVDMAETMANSLKLNVALVVEKPLSPDKLARLDKAIL